MRLLVTGASGLVGGFILSECAAAEYEVHAVTSNAKTGEQQQAQKADWHVCDLTRPGSAAALIESVRPTHVIHCAWDTRHPVYWNSAENFAWLAATAEMAAAFARSGGQRFVLVGTCAEYDWTHGFMIEDVTPERPNTVYGWAKLAAHNAMFGAARLGFSAVTARIFFSYGPNENPGRFIPYICRTLAAGDTPKLSGGHQLRDMLHARDTAGALMALARDTTISGAVNIGSGQPVTLAQVAKTLARIAGRPEDSGIGRLPNRENDPLILLPSVSRLFSTGWHPTTSLEQGLGETYEWWAHEAHSGDAA